MIEAVLFDLDDTLCAYRRSRAEVLARAFDHADVEPFFSVEDYYAVWDDYVVPGEGKDAQIEASFVALAEERDVAPEIGQRVARAFADERDHRDVSCLPGARETLEALAADHRIGLVTNGAPDMQTTKLDALGLVDVFETAVHGGYDAPKKPAPEPFHRALDALAVEPAQAVHVGDSLDSDVAGAKRAGLRAAWIPDSPKPEPGDVEPNYVLSSLSELSQPPWAREG